MIQVEPDQLLTGRVLVLSPHFDDEVLGCGGTIARLSEKENLHVAYITDGSASPRLPSPMVRKQIDLPALREAESREAMATLGVPDNNLHFFRIQEGRVPHAIEDLERSLRALFFQLRPELVLVPFRFDRHPDHLAVNRVASRLRAEGQTGFRMIEYFIYYRSRLLPSGDLRAYLHPSLLVAVDIREVTSEKRRALDCFRTQVTTIVEGQTRPILSEELIDAFSRVPEVFLRSELAADTDLFSVPLWYIQLAQTAEWRLKRWKYVATTSLAAQYRRLRPEQSGSAS